jgi:hypothetical protein
LFALIYVDKRQANLAKDQQFCKKKKQQDVSYVKMLNGKDVSPNNLVNALTILTKHFCLKVQIFGPYLQFVLEGYVGNMWSAVRQLDVQNFHVSWSAVSTYLAFTCEFRRRAVYLREALFIA